MNPTDNNTDLVTELTRTALAIHAGKRGRGSFSPVLNACVQQYIMTLAKETMYLVNAHDRPPARIAETAYKALSALEAAILKLIDDDRIAAEECEADL